MKEEWKQIKDWPEHYFVSNLGRVKTVSRTIKVKTRTSKITGKILKQSLCALGYPFVALYKNGSGGGRAVHRLVAKAFIPNPNNLPQVNHIDGDKTNNNVKNLEWVTAKQNIQHAHRINKGVVKRGKQPVLQIKDQDVVKIFKSISEASSNTGIDRSCISRCCSGSYPSAGGYKWKYLLTTN